MKIIADANLANIESLLADYGELTLLPGREITAERVKGHDALIVRSITRVDKILLAGSSVRFVGTATSGLDHIDLDYLHNQEITLAHAAGSNADAVTDYCLAAMTEKNAFASDSVPTVGIVGFGQVGSRLHRRLTAMGIAVRVCDPLVEGRITAIDKGLSKDFADLNDLADCDVVSLHVPLTDNTTDATKHMIGHEFLANMNPQALLINTCRGGVVDEQALLAALRNNQAPHCVIDVWEREPAVNPELVARAAIATPHIAGYSARAKLSASETVVAQLRQHIENFAEYQSASPSNPDHLKALSIEKGSYRGRADLLRKAVRPGIDLIDLDSRFKKAVLNAGNTALAATVFDGFRNELRSRLEFSELNAMQFRDGEQGLEAGDQALLIAAGFA